MIAALSWLAVLMGRTEQNRSIAASAEREGDVELSPTEAHESAPDVREKNGIVDKDGLPLDPKPLRPVLLTLKRWLEGRLGIVFADALNLMLFVLTLVAIVVSLISLYVAIETKRSADASGLQQQKTLEAARNSLVTVVSALDQSNKSLSASSATAQEEQKELKLQVQSSERQLSILDSEWRIEQAKPDVQAVLVNSTKPSIILENRSTIKPVLQGSYQVILVDLDQPIEGGHLQMFSTKTTDTGWIRPGGSFLPSLLDFVASPSAQMQDGHRFYGYMVVDCSDCKEHRVYGVYIELGRRGFFRELSSKEYFYANFRKQGIEDRTRSFLASSGLVSLD